MSNVQNSTILMGLYKSVSHVDLPSISQALVSLTEDSSPLTALSNYPPPPLIVKFKIPQLALFPLPIFPDCSSKQHAWDAKKLEPKQPVFNYFAFPQGFGEGER